MILDKNIRGQRFYPLGDKLLRGDLNAFPYAPTLEGQYIIKNIVLVSGGLVVGATVRGGGLTANPQGVEAARQKEEKSDPARTLTSSTRRPS